MKKIFLLTCLLVFTFFSYGQILKKITDRTKNNANNKVNNTANKTVDDAMNPDKNNNSVDTTRKKEDSTTSITKSETSPASFKAYSKYDFVPGEKIIGFEDFSTGSIGDFPAGWNTTSSGELVTIENKPGRWLWFTRPGVFTPEFPEPFPEDFTFEFDRSMAFP